MHLKALTGLRFFAAIAIVLLHIKSYYDYQFFNSLPPALVYGVSFFFVLSGFILTHVYGNKAFPGYFTFLTARFARIWPVHISAFALLILFVPANSVTFDGEGFFGKGFTLFTNILLLQSFIPFPVHFFSYNSLSWSISTEFFFYLMFPLLIVNLRETWRTKLFLAFCGGIAMVMIAWSMQLPQESSLPTALSYSSFLYPFPLARIFEFTLGMVSYIFWSAYIKDNLKHYWFATTIEICSVVLLVLWACNILNVIQNINPPELHQWIATIGACPIFAILICAMANGNGLLGQFLGSKIMVFLGEISFAIYMYHQVLLKIFKCHFPQLNGIQGILVFFSTLIVICSISFFLIEKPARTWIIKKSQALLALKFTSKKAVIYITASLGLFIIISGVTQYKADFDIIMGKTIYEGQTAKVVKKNNILYFMLKPASISADEQDYFFVHVIPKNLADLPTKQSAHGFDNYDFPLNKVKKVKSAIVKHYTSYPVIVARSMPDYAIKQIETGQINPDSGEVYWATSGN